FHRENGTCFCDSPQAVGYRQMEQAVLEANPQSLVVRTQAFGWSQVPGRTGLPERVVETLVAGGAVRLDCQRHATPILATDLADVLELARQKSLSGVYHVGGGERVSPFRTRAPGLPGPGRRPSPRAAGQIDRPAGTQTGTG
ncbi:MAG: hypothetical protein ACKOJF_29335, partial [Planctomycetaceae bacterium]